MLRTTGSPATARVVGWVFILIGLPIMGLGWHLLQKERARVAHSVRTTGVVESLATNKYAATNRPGTSSSTAPLIRYQDAAGHTFRFAASAAASRPTLYAVGESVTVYYDPARPYDAQLHGFLAQWMGPAMALGMGLVFILLGWMCVALLGKAGQPGGTRSDPYYCVFTRPNSWLSRFPIAAATLAATTTGTSRVAPA